MARKRRPSRSRMLKDILRRRVMPERALAQSMQAWLGRWKASVEGRIQRGQEFSTFFSESDKASFTRVLRTGLARASYVGLQFERQWIELNGHGKAKAQKAKEDSAAQWERRIFVEMDQQAIRELEAFLDGRTVGIWGRVSDTLRHKLQVELRRSIVEGEALSERIKSIRAVLGNSKKQAERIARTETVAGMNAGQQGARTDAGIDFKEWSSTIDKWTRPSGKRGGAFNHRVPDMQIQPNEKPFIVSGEKLMYPGDISLGASGGNVIQCRCASVAAFPDDKELKLVGKDRTGFEGDNEPAIKVPSWADLSLDD